MGHLLVTPFVAFTAAIANTNVHFRYAFIIILQVVIAITVVAIILDKITNSIDLITHLIHHRIADVNSDHLTLLGIVTDTDYGTEV